MPYLDEARQERAKRLIDQPFRHLLSAAVSSFSRMDLISTSCTFSFLRNRAHFLPPRTKDARKADPPFLGFQPHQVPYLDEARQEGAKRLIEKKAAKLVFQPYDWGLNSK